MGTPIRIGIINDCDEPSAKMLAIAIGEPGAAKIEYLNVRCASLKRHWKTPSSLLHWIDATTFGVELALKQGGFLKVTQTAGSTATYPDGFPRLWQGDREAEIIVRKTCVASVIRFLKAAIPPA